MQYMFEKYVSVIGNTKAIVTKMAKYVGPIHHAKL